MSNPSETVSLTKGTRLVRVVITKDNMAAMMALISPEPGDPEITEEIVRDAIARAGVVHGINWDVVKKAIEKHEYEVPTKIAVGTKPKKGADAYFEYTFETEGKHTPEEDKDGRIDYRNLSFLQNVKEGEVLVTKTPPQKGIDGKGVDGTIIKAPMGRDIPLLRGQNTKVSDDGLKLLAATSGAIFFSRGQVAVNDLTVIRGDVDMSTGNIECLGSLKISGDIHAGFSLSVGGNLEVHGNVEDCNIECKGNILIKGGCFGKSAGCIHAGGNIVVKYAEGMKITSDQSVTVGGELLNCHVHAKDFVELKGQRGRIIGGEIYAGREIRAYSIGSEAGTQTVLHAAFDAELMQKYREIEGELVRIESDIIRVKDSLLKLHRLRIDGRLNDQQAQILKQLEEFKASVPGEIESLRTAKAEVEEKIKEMDSAVVIVEHIAYPGVSIHFGHIYKEITEQAESVKFTMETNHVSMSEYHKESG